LFANQERKGSNGRKNAPQLGPSTPERVSRAIVQTREQLRTLPIKPEHRKSDSQSRSEARRLRWVGGQECPQTCPLTPEHILRSIVQTKEGLRTLPIKSELEGSNSRSRSEARRLRSAELKNAPQLCAMAPERVLETIAPAKEWLRSLPRKSKTHGGQ
jgi:hypothetical protein